MRKEKKIVHYGVQCPDCKKRMFSYYTHDFRMCGCKNQTTVDGGFDYLQYGWKTTKPKRIKHTERLDGVLPGSIHAKLKY